MDVCVFPGTGVGSDGWQMKHESGADEQNENELRATGRVAAQAVLTYTNSNTGDERRWLGTRIGAATASDTTGAAASIEAVNTIGPIASAWEAAERSPIPIVVVLLLAEGMTCHHFWVKEQ